MGDWSAIVRIGAYVEEGRGRGGKAGMPRFEGFLERNAEISTCDTQSEVVGARISSKVIN